MIWLWWLGGALVLGVIETLTADLTFLMLAGGALGGALTASVGGPAWVQVIVFAIVSALLLVLVRPWAKRRLAHATPAERTNAEALIGASAVALTAVSAREGRVSLAGGEWSARLVSPISRQDPVPDSGVRAGLGQAQTVPAGTELSVVGIDGAYALVTPTQPMTPSTGAASPTESGAHA